MDRFFCWKHFLTHFYYKEDEKSSLDKNPKGKIELKQQRQNQV